MKVLQHFLISTKLLISLQIARTTLYWGEYTAKWELYFAYEGLTEEVLQAYRNAYHYLQLGKDSLTSAYALRDLGRAFNLLEITDSTIYYYNKAYQLANSNGDIQREVNISKNWQASIFKWENMTKH